jgi:hypothetical protein
VSAVSIPHKYGLSFPVQLNDLELEYWCFKRSHPTDKGGLGKYRHFLNISRMVLPETKFHDWSRIQIQSLCSTEYAVQIGSVIHRYVYWPGCAAAAKTFSSAHYAFLWWLASPMTSTVILTSTSGKMVKTRIWPKIQDFFYQARKTLSDKFKVDESLIKTGNLLDSQTILQREKGDSLRAIMALSVEPGELGKTVAKLQGIHNERILLIVDEATDTPEAIFRVIPNLAKGCSDLTVLLIGNPISRTLDPFDRACQPVNGWESVTVEDIEWKAKGDRELCLEPGLTVRFRGKESPNVKARKTIYPFLYSWEDFQRDEGKEDTIEYWKWTEGFPPPEGVCNTVLSEAMIAKYGVRDKHTFLSKSDPLSGLDPGFEGDKCIDQFGLLGDLNMGKMGLQLTESVTIRPLSTSEHELDYQISQSAIAECKKRKVVPQNHGSDSTGTGRGVYSHTRTDWGECVRVEFGGMASERPASEEDPRPSHEVYANRVTELWFFVRSIVVSGQLKGIPQAAIQQFCSRQYSVKNRKIVLETKLEFKKKFGHSPDEADAVVVICEVARQRGLVAGTVLAISKEEINFVKAQNDVYDEDTRFNTPFEQTTEEAFVDW